MLSGAQDFHNAGYRDWTITHAFFADMGGFLVKMSDVVEAVPVNAEQLLYLIRKAHMEYPEFDKKAIDDKNKHDGLARYVQGNITPSVIVSTY